MRPLRSRSLGTRSGAALPRPRRRPRDRPAILSAPTAPRPSHGPRRAAAAPLSLATRPHPRPCWSRARTAVDSGGDVPTASLLPRQRPVFRASLAALVVTSPRARRQTRGQTRVRLEARASEPRLTLGRRPGAGAASEREKTTGGSGGASPDAGTRSSGTTVDERCRERQTLRRKQRRRTRPGR